MCPLQSSAHAIINLHSQGGVMWAFCCWHWKLKHLTLIKKLFAEMELVQESTLAFKLINMFYNIWILPEMQQIKLSSVLFYFKNTTCTFNATFFFQIWGYMGQNIIYHLCATLNYYYSHYFIQLKCLLMTGSSTAHKTWDVVNCQVEIVSLVPITEFSVLADEEHKFPFESINNEQNEFAGENSNMRRRRAIYLHLHSSNR